MPRLAAPVNSDRNGSSGTGALGRCAPHPAAGFAALPDRFGRGPRPAGQGHRRDLEINFKTVALWRKRFRSEGPDCLWEVAEGRGRKPPLTPQGGREDCGRDAPNQARRGDALELPDHGQGPGREQSHRQSDLAKPSTSNRTGPRISNSRGIRKFLEKLTDVVGLYLNPPQKALVLCVDEKSQIQALDRTQPGLPLKKGRCGTMTHDYKRNGTTTLFAALEVAQGKVIGQCYARHRHQEFLKFLQRLDAEFPGEVKLHVVMDNYGTHKHPRVQAWLKRHPRFISHFIPTSSSWLNLVERWFGELTGKRIRRGVFVSVEDLIAAIEEFLAAWNDDPKPFVWTATVDSIVEKLKRCRQTLEQINPVAPATVRKNKK